ncbi:MAG TPA: sigma-70 family RNA polymerase sigma factor, partial [Polyangiaceae bacterium]
ARGRSSAGNGADTRMASPTDRELVDRAKSGDSMAFGSLVRRYQRRIFRLAFHLVRTGAEAEDVTQETFVRAYQALDRFDGRSEAFTWIYRIAVNLSLNTIRARKSDRKGVSADDPRLEGALVETRAGSASPQGASESRELGRALCEGMDSLSDTLRTTLILVGVDGLSHAQAGEVLGCPEGTVAWRVHEARKKLKAYLLERGFAPAGEEGAA